LGRDNGGAARSDCGRRLLRSTRLGVIERGPELAPSGADEPNVEGFYGRPQEDLTRGAWCRRPSASSRAGIRAALLDASTGGAGEGMERRSCPPSRSARWCRARVRPGRVISSPHATRQLRGADSAPGVRRIVVGHHELEFPPDIVRPRWTCSPTRIGRSAP
jgi:hypothetical protein